MQATLNSKHDPLRYVYPNVAKVGGLQSQGAKGEAVISLLRTLGNAGSGALRLSRRVKKMEKNRTDPGMYCWFVPEIGARFFLTPITFGEIFTIFFMQRWGLEKGGPISMQTEEDKKLQSKLESAGKGLPFIEALMLRHIFFPILKTFMSWDMGMRLFEYGGKRILNDVKKLDDSAIFKKVLIPRILGIEDNSRYYSPAMVLWHLIYVGETIQEGIISLSKNETFDLIVKIENFKPFVEISHDIVNEYEVFLKEYGRTIEENVKDKYIRNYHAHPWIGPLNPHQWLIMSAVHQLIHKRQLRKIIKIIA